MASTTKYTGPHDSCDREGLHEHDVGEHPEPWLQILSVRHPDDSTRIRVFVHGVEIHSFDEENVDPGAGYEAEDYRERLDRAKAFAAASDANDYDRACLEALVAMRAQFRKYALMDGEEWDAIVDAPEPPDTPRDAIKARLEYLRGQVRAERLSWGEVAELQGLADHVEPGDAELAEWAGIDEQEFARRMHRFDTGTRNDTDTEGGAEGAS
jgi:hypothetical protein